MKIAIFTDTFHPTIDGVVISIDAIARSLQVCGHEVRFFSPRPKNPDSAQKMISGLDVHWVPSTGLWTYPNYRIASPISPRTYRVFREFDPDVTHVHSPFSLGWIGLDCARRARIPVVATYHTYLPGFLMYLPIRWLRDAPWAQRLTWKFSAWFYNKANLVTTPSKLFAQQLHENHGKEATALPNPIRFALFNQFAGMLRPKEMFRLCFFGRVSYEKNIEALIECVRLLRSRGRPIELWLIGEGPAEGFVRKQVDRLGVTDRVKIFGALRDEALAQALAQCHCLVTPSTIETQGLTILEAMAAGLPCIGADCLAIPETITDNHNGFLFPPGRAETAADRIERLMDSPDVYDAFSKAAIETAREYSAPVIASRYVALYRELIARKKR